MMRRRSDVSVKKLLLTCTVLLLICYLNPVACDCTCDKSEQSTDHGDAALKYKLAGIGTILAAGGLGVSLPLLGRKIPALRPENDIFFLIKAFAAGVILATGFIHILPDAFDDLTSPCLKDDPWGRFPFTGFVAMMSAIGTLMIDTLATGYYKRQHFVKRVKNADEEQAGDEHAGHIHVHTHATHGHAHGSTGGDDIDSSEQLIRHRIVSKVLELGIVVHSIIIGISLGASQDVDTIKPLLAALSFHQFFEGLGLGGCISQAQFKSMSAAMMGGFFSLTTPVGIAIGIWISGRYDENSPTSLAVEGTLNAASAGILIYMALVDLLAADFMSPRLQSNFRIQLGANVSLLLGAACMSLLAKWA